MQPFSVSLITASPFPLLHSSHMKLLSGFQNREFPGGPVIRTLTARVPGARVRSLVRELRSHKLPRAAKTSKKTNKNSSLRYNWQNKLNSNHPLDLNLKATFPRKHSLNPKMWQTVLFFPNIHLSSLRGFYTSTHCHVACNASWEEESTSPPHRCWALPHNLL